MSILELYDEVIAEGRAAFLQQRSHALWANLLVGWLLTVSRCTITGMLLLADEEQRHAHDAYHRLLRVGTWSLTQLFALLAKRLVALLPPDVPLPLSADDTLAAHGGPQVAGAGWFRDPVRSTKTKPVHTHGLRLLLVCLCVPVPWGDAPLALPIHLRVLPKGDEETAIQALDAMIREILTWFPTRNVSLVADGAYAAYAAYAPARVTFTSRLRSDAKLFKPPTPKPPHRRGRQAQKGARLSTPAQRAQTPGLAWETVTVRRGQRVLTRWIYQYPAVRQFGQNTPHKKYVPIHVVLVRDPAGVEKDDYFFSTALAPSGEAVVTEYGDRWPIEVTIREDKQLLGLEEPQCWKGAGPARAAGIALWLYSLVWYLHLQATGAPPIASRPWYRQKRTPSFADALATVRLALWSRKCATFSRTGTPPPILDRLLTSLAYAA